MSYSHETKHGISIFHTDNEDEKGIDKRRPDFLNRYQFKAHYREIDNTRKVKALIREGKHSWPGGYAVVPFTSEGACLCVDCIKENLSSVLWSIKNDVSDGWRVVGLDTYYGVEDNGHTVCDNCGKDWENI